MSVSGRSHSDQHQSDHRHGIAKQRRFSHHMSHANDPVAFLHVDADLHSAAGNGSNELRRPAVNVRPIDILRHDSTALPSVKLGYGDCWLRHVLLQQYPQLP